VAGLVKELIASNKLIEFTMVRAKFENFLVDHKNYINQLTTQYGSMVKGHKQMREYLAFVLDKCISGHQGPSIEYALAQDVRFAKLAKEKPTLTSKPKNFSTEAKQFKVIKDSLDKAFVCSLCGARVAGSGTRLTRVIPIPTATASKTNS